ncbi:hypothetical protein [Paenibacillus sinopodophylli]|uniref:hypothetical protein n=1 Tax=Paenibacillus sinopodophylli TaxID=1837342 RepID=UPI003CCC5870
MNQPFIAGHHVIGAIHRGETRVRQFDRGDCLFYRSHRQRCECRDVRFTLENTAACCGSCRGGQHGVCAQRRI